TAPGATVLTTQPGGRYADVSGTAVAAAHVGGAMALAISQFYGKHSTPTLLRAFLDPKASDVVQGLQFETMGGNRLNVDKFLTYVSKL
ncbi:MAG: S8 family serine peptidase, partial [Bdellovibrionota bacterium]